MNGLEQCRAIIAPGIYLAACSNDKKDLHRLVDYMVCAQMELLKSSITSIKNAGNNPEEVSLLVNWN